ncbi:MAG: hypothetical protein ACI85O_002450 [Saprospiraceae bacterium]|jgi:hypothetical protein
MKKSTRRYLFLDFEDLKDIKFRKIEKVCDRIFIFIRKEEKQIPVDLVQKMQRFGRNAKWVAIDGLDIMQTMNYHISFLMGKLHERIDTEIEFAVLSNDENFDPLVTYINTKGGRSCLRVKGKQREKVMEETPSSTPRRHPATSNYTLIDEMKSEKELQAFSAPVTPREVEPAILVSAGYDDEKLKSEEPIVRSVTNQFTLLDNSSNGDSDTSGFDDGQIVNRTAEETVSRLVRSGNRPALISTLKNYILLHNQELTVHGNIDAIISCMEEKKEIEVKKEEVIYHF